MEPRQAILLTLVIEQHINTAEPVGSKFLVEQANLNWSEATVRNELRGLEEAGYLTHPHTSAGRLPTTEGYRYYVEHLDFSAAALPRAERLALSQAAGASHDYASSRKSVARALGTLADEAVVVAFSLDAVYYTGLANLFQKPDFAALNLVVDVSQVFDRCEEVLPDFFAQVDEEPRYFLGDEHPFGGMLSVLSLRFGRRQESLLAIVGPQRMDYRHNWELVQTARELI
ncbi:MAG: hypothetical protein HYV42_02625 [Candidatus Magasanikbacteria bacterium]|nr:hypothetical protein [Candidatus Magasanikbacteria bacterium]